MSEWIESKHIKRAEQLFSFAMAHVRNANLTTNCDACRHGQCKEETASWCCPCSPCRRAVGEVAGHDTFHGLGRLDELCDGAGHALGVDGQLLLEIVGGLLDNLQARRQTKSRPLRFPFYFSLPWGHFCWLRFRCSLFTYKLLNFETGSYSPSTAL